MRINEIIDAPTEPSDLDLQATKDQYRMSRNKRQAGSGVFSVVYQNYGEVVPSVTKLARFNEALPRKDGYYNWIKRVIKLQNNPYIPQLNKVVIKRPSADSSQVFDHQQFLVVDMESLIDSARMEVDELHFVLKRLLGRKLDEREKDYLSSNSRANYFIEELLVNSVKRRAWQPLDFQNSVTVATDPEFLMVAKLLNFLWRQGYSIDLHPGNYMFRRTPYGPQLVITDPLSWHYSGVQR